MSKLARLRDAARCVAALALGCAVASAQQKPPAWVAEGPKVDAAAFAFELPVEVVGTKLLVEVELGGKPRRFVFDTGSPSMMRASLAAELDLKAVDTRKGRDSHGAIIESRIVQADLTLGGVTFRKVPVFAADFSASKAATCILGDGVLGSELLPLCAWQVDLPDGVVRCNTDIANLKHVVGASKQRLHDFGYPHAPILDVHFAEEARSKAMLDTGSPEYLAISPPDFEGARRARGVGRTTAGHGSLGSSLGGQAPSGRQSRADLKNFSIGSLHLGRVDSVVRESPPSLIGASILEHFVVTLDPRSEAAYFDAYRDGPFARPSFGFSLAFDDGISVALVWEGSPAWKVGLRPGQRLTSINGEATSGSCEGIRRALDAMSAGTIAVGWDGADATLTAARR